jgi:hypothetical protein
MFQNQSKPGPIGLAAASILGRKTLDQATQDFEYGMPGTVRDMGEIAKQCQLITANLDMLENRLGDLANAVQPVLSPDYPTTQGEGYPGQESQMGDFLSQQNHRLDELIGRLSNIVGRIRL